MKKHLHALSLFLCLAGGLFSAVSGQVTEKNGTPQAPNYDFEVWDDPEPWGWNSSSCFEAYNKTSFDRKQSVWTSNDIRPGSKGSTSVRIQVTKSSWKAYKFPSIKSWTEAMGTLTTGTLYYHFSKSETESCIYTNTGDDSKRWAFTGRPDSVVFWVKKGVNGGRPADFTLYLHNNKKLEDRNPNGTAVGTVIGSAACKITNTDWQRISLPIAYASNDTPSYLLVSFTAGNNFREVVEGDELYVDDLLFIYRPGLTIDLDPTLPVPVRKSDATVSLEVPFTLNGTMSPFNSEADNVVYAELSDENGSFDQARIIGQLTTDESGAVAATLPAGELNISDNARYRLRLRATNYPLLSENEIALDLHYVYRLSVSAEPTWAAEVRTIDTMLRENTVYTATYANVMTGRHFAGWIVNGENVSDALSFTLPMTQDYTLTARFDTNYYGLTLSAGTGGRLDLNGSETVNAGEHYENRLIHNSILNLTATPDFGYHFREWRLNGETLSADNPLVYTLTDEAELQAVFDTNTYGLSFSAVPADMGSASNSGTYKHFTAMSSTAEAAPYAQFLYWRVAGSEEPCSYEAVLPIESVSAASAYEAVFASQTFHVTTAAEPAECGQTHGDAVYEAFPLTAEAQVEAVAAEGYHFTYWTLTVDGQNQADRPADNPYVFVKDGHVTHDYGFTAHFDINRYALTVEAEHGAVEGAGAYEHHAAVTLTATPDHGYAFAGWYEAETLLGDEPTLNLDLTAERHLTAVFRPMTYTLTFAVLGDESLGRITNPTEAEGIYAHFTSIGLTAEPTEGNEFRYWLVNGDTVAETAAYTLAVDGAKTVEAVFSPLRKQLTVLNPQDDRGTVKGGGRFEHGSTVELTAAPAYGYTFAGWTDAEGQVSTGNPLRIEALTEDRTYTAHFEPMPFALCIDNPTPEQGAFSVKGETPAENCVTFPYLTTLTLAATPAPEHRFLGWQNADTKEILTDNPLTWTLQADLTLTALFDQAAYAVQGAAYPAEAADITGSDDYYLNATAVLEATPRFGFEFNGWYDEQGLLLTTETRLSFNVEKAVYYVARLSRLNFTLGVAAEPAGDGTVSGGGIIPFGYNTKIEATAADGRQFNGWFNADGQLVSDQAVHYPVVTKDETLTAHFGPKALQATLTCEPADAGRIIRIGQAEAEGFFHGISAQIQAEPAETYTFSHWTDGAGRILGETAVLTLTPTADADLTLTAHFAPRAFNPDVTVVPEQAGEIDGLEDQLIYGKTYTATVRQTDEHYRFIGWCNADGQTLSTETAYTFTFLNRPLSARFEALPVTVETVCEPAEAGRTELTGEARYFETVTLTAQPARGYRFAGWHNTDDATETFGGTPELTRVLTGDLRLTARFEKEVYALQVTAYPAQSGTVDHPAKAAFGETVTLTAEPAEGYAFYAYENADGQIVSYEPTYTTVMDEALSLTAHFEPRSYTLKVVSADKTIGQVKGSGLFAFGETATVKAWPSAQGYAFSHWSNNPQGTDTLSTEAEYRHTIDAENRTVYACFKLKTIHIAAGVNLPEAGALQGAGDKTYGETVTLEASANEGYVWLGFGEYDVILTEDPTYTFTATEDRRITGLFRPMMWQVTVTDLPEGVSVKGAGETAHGTEAVLEAALPTALELAAWVDATGDTLGHDNPLHLTVTGDLEIHPVCAPRRLPLHVTCVPAAAGRMLTDGFTDNTGTFRYGEDVRLAIEAAHGYTFAGWEEDGVLLSRDNPYVYRILNESHLKAVFTAEGWTISTGTNLALGGTTAGDGIYPQGDTVEVTAVPNEGFDFIHWTENGEIVSTDATYRFAAENDRLLVADFQVHYFQILVEAEPSVSAKVSGSGAYSAKDTVTLTAEPSKGYAFIGWECEGERLSNATTYRFVPERDMRIVAKTKKLTASVEVTATPMHGGTISGGGEYPLGSVVTLTAEPADGFSFLYWADDRMNNISTQSSYSFTATADVRIIAMFGSKNTSEDPHIELYPVPFTGEVHLEGENMSKIMWFNAFGIKIAQFDINSNSHTVMPTNAWPKGLYVYRIVRNSGKVVKGKALKL